MELHVQTWPPPKLAAFRRYCKHRATGFSQRAARLPDTSLSRQAGLDDWLYRDWDLSFGGKRSYGKHGSHLITISFWTEPYGSPAQIKAIGWSTAGSLYFHVSDAVLRDIRVLPVLELVYVAMQTMGGLLQLASPPPQDAAAPGQMIVVDEGEGLPEALRYGWFVDAKRFAWLMPNASADLFWDESA